MRVVDFDVTWHSRTGDQMYRSLSGLATICVFILSGCGAGAPQTVHVHRVYPSSDTPSAVSSTAVARTPPVRNPEPEPHPGFKRESASMLIWHYEENEIRADSFFKGKKLAIHGYVASVGKDILGNAYLLLDDGYFGKPTVRKVQCYFRDPRDIMYLSKYSEVVVEGVCDGLMLNVQIQDCHILR